MRSPLISLPWSRIVAKRTVFFSGILVGAHSISCQAETRPGKCSNTQIVHHLQPRGTICARFSPWIRFLSVYDLVYGRRSELASSETSTMPPSTTCMHLVCRHGASTFHPGTACSRRPLRVLPCHIPCIDMFVRDAMVSDGTSAPTVLVPRRYVLKGVELILIQPEVF